MKILHATAKNFQSYEDLEFNYSDLGLALVSGANGSGKSTLLDLCAWTLFGVTSKDGASDDVRSWNGEGATVGEVQVSTPQGTIYVRRTRGPNDLYFIEDGADSWTRGKDLSDTQKLLEKRLGVTADLFFTGSYLHQFSQADSFFIAKAKDRRDVLEKIADQDFAINLGNKASEARKVAKKEADTLALSLSRAEGRELALSDSLENLSKSSETWLDNQAIKIEQAKRMDANFKSQKESEIKTLNAQLCLSGSIVFEDLETKLTVLRTRLLTFKPIKDQLTKISGRLIALKSELQVIKRDKSKFETIAHACPTCKRDYDEVPDYSKEIKALEDKQKITEQSIAVTETLEQELKQELSDEEAVRQLIEQTVETKSKEAKAAVVRDSLRKQIVTAESRTNPYTAQVAALETETDPFAPRIDGECAKLEEAQKEVDTLRASLEETNHKVVSLTQIYDTSFKLRGLLMEKAVKSIEDATNGYLERYFDAALRISLVISGSDKIEVEIMNDGNLAPFKALSGGERCMLKLSFSLAVMKAAQNRAGISFDLLMLDEPFNGLNSERKVQAFGLLQELEQEYGSVLVIDHDAELKSQFHKVFSVEKNGTTSQVYES